MLAALLAISVIIGGSVSNPNPPTGSCQGLSFNLQNLGSVDTFTTGDPNPGSAFAINSSARVAWGLSNSSGAGIRLGLMDLSVPQLSAQNQLNTNNNDPSATTSYSGIYNPTMNQFLAVLSKVVAPCNVTNCLQVKGIAGSAVLSDSQFPTIQHDSSPDIAHAVDGSFVYLQTWNAVAGTARLYRFTNPGLNAGSFAQLDGISPQWADDGTFLYGVNPTTADVYQVNKNTMALSTHTVPGALNFNSAVATDGLYLYIVGGNAGSGRIYQVDLSNFTVSGQVLLSATETGTLQGLSYDVTNHKLYALTQEAAADSFVVRRIGVAPYANEQTLTVLDTGKAGWVGAPDFLYLRYWVQDADTPSHLHQILLCS